MKKRLRRRSGMLMLVLAATLSLVMILFISMLNRMRNEAAITNKVAVNERLYQVASALSRLSIRKLQNDFEMREPNHGQKIVDTVFSGKTGKMEETDYTSVIRSMKAAQELVKRFKDKWGKNGEISFTVKYIVDLGQKGPFDAPIAGVSPNEYERKGNIDMVVAVTLEALGVTRKYTVRKEFILARLLAPPYYRFTLFSPRGATIKNEDANKQEYDDCGVVTSGGRPMVCLNRLNTSANKDLIDYAKNCENVIQNKGADAFVKNGWIYLGGRGRSTDMRGEDGKLILNVVPGSGDDDLSTKFGEYFHFYFNKESAGWLLINNWTNWLNSNIADNNGKVQMAFVNYGIYKGLWDLKFADKYLFKDKVESLYRATVTGSTDSLKKGSSMHLFGTPSHCTPTLIFGPVQRRYLRAFALLFTEFGRVFPLHVVTDYSDLRSLFKGIIPSWYIVAYQQQNNSEPNNTFYDSISEAFMENLFKDTSTGYSNYFNGISSENLVGIGPKIVDEEPYMQALQNMSSPKSPDRKWPEAVPNNDFVKNDCKELCNEEYEFKDAKESFYTGNITDIKIDYDTYLKDRTSYTLTVKGDDAKLSKNEFMQKHFFTDDENKDFYLNQIIRIEGDFTIDQQLKVKKGGIIVCTGKVTITAPILNNYIENGYNSTDNPDSFGYLTIVAQKGIDINSTAGKADNPLPKIEGFFIATNDSGDASVHFQSGMHVIGGIVSDDVSNIVEKGCIIEWGFEPDECTNLACKDFYGLVLGPRDIEIFSGE